MTKYFNEFAQHITTLGRVHDLSRVFNDFLTMGICSYHRDNIQSRLRDQNEENETLYLCAAESYTEDELGLFVECLAYLSLNVYYDPYSDTLGDFFTRHITQGQNGQFFTPDPVCELMSQLTLNEDDCGKRILDPACGSGRILLNAAKQNHKNYFFGADNTITCAKMATLNFFFNGLVGEVAWMDSLSMEWYGGWQINTNSIGILPIEKEHSQIWSEAPKRPHPEPPKGKPDDKAGQPAHQLSLF